MSKSIAIAALGVLAAMGLTACNRSQAQPGPGVRAPTAAAGPARGACPSIGTLAETRGGPIVLNGQRMVRLTTLCSAAAMTEHLRLYGEGTRYLLVADDLRAGVQPGVLFHLSFGAPTTGEPAVLGTLSFFSAMRPGTPGTPHSVSYDVTNQVRAFAVAGWPAQGLGVAIAPQGAVTPGADASIGALRLVAQAPR